MYIRRNIDGAFRALPSLMPIKSPSPDRKGSNIISPTISPQAEQIKKSVTPTKNMPQYESSTNYKTNLLYEDSYGKRFFSNHSDTKIQQKDEIIDELKRVIRILTKNQNINYEQQFPRIDQLKKQLKVLTIENQKLLTVIQKQKRNQHSKDLPIFQYKRQIEELHQTLKRRGETHNRQIDDLMQAHKSLANHCKDLENENKNYEKQNSKLMKLLKEKDESQRKMYEQSKEKDYQKSGFGEKLILSKIKDQYNENFRMFKENVYYEVDTTFQKVNAKVSQLQNRLQLMEKKVNILLKHKPDISRISQSSQNSNSSAKKVQKDSQPQIFIDEGPSSGSNSKHSPSDLSHIIQQSHKEQSRVNQLEQQLNKTKKQLEEIRFKYEKICLDTNTTAFSRMKIDDLENSKDSKGIQYSQQDSNRQDGQGLKFSNQRTIELKNQQIKDLEDSYNRKIQQLKYFKDKQLEQLKQETQQTIKKLIDTYNKELQLLRKQNLKKTQSLSQFAEKTTNKETQYQEEIGTLKKQIQHLQQELQQQKSNLQQTTIQQQFMINQLSQENTNLKNQIDQQKQKMHQYEQQKVQMQETINIVNDNITQLGNQLEQKKKNIQELQQENKLAQKQWIKEKEDILKEHQNLFEKIRQQYQQENQSKQQVIRLIKEQMENLVQQKSELKTKIKNIRRDHLINQLKQLKHMIDDQKIASNQENIKRLDNLFQNSSKMNTHKIQQVQQLMKDKLNLQSKLLQLSQKQTKSHEMIQLLEKKIALYENQLREKSLICEKLIEEKAKIEGINSEKLQAIIEMTKEQVSKYQIQQSDIKAKIAQILAKQEENSKQIQNLIQYS